MLVTYQGHSCFRLLLETGVSLVTDPYGDFYQYPKRCLKADLCTVSHHHHDHDGMSIIDGKPLIIDTPGVHLPAAGVRIVGIPTKHDHHNGQKRGDNTVFVLETEGLRIAHAGDLGHVPTQEQQKQIGRLDVLLLPIGGFYTIGVEEALQTIALLKPKVTIPMHYRTRLNPEMPIEPLDPFLEAAHVHPEPMALLRLSAGDMSEREPIIVMKMDEA